MDDRSRCGARSEYFRGRGVFYRASLAGEQFFSKASIVPLLSRSRGREYHPGLRELFLTQVLELLIASTRPNFENWA